MKSYKYHGYNSQDEYDYYNRQSKQDSAEIAAICFALIFVMLLAAVVVAALRAIW